MARVVGGDALDFSLAARESRDSGKGGDDQQLTSLHDELSYGLHYQKLI